MVLTLFYMNIFEINDLFELMAIYVLFYFLFA